MRHNAIDDAEDVSDVEDGHTNHEETNKRKRKAKDASQDDGPACHSCRKKKAKCSRTQPCTHCQRYNIECVYEEKTARPGFKTGAIESLNRRVDALENMFLGQGVLWEQVLKSLSAVGASSSIEVDLPTPSTGSTLQEHTDQLQRCFSALAAKNQHAHQDSNEPCLAKRRRLQDGEVPDGENRGLLDAQDTEASTELPPQDLMDSLVQTYFEKIHPWIPMLHVRKFREAIADPAQRARQSTILHAIVSLCVRFSDDARLDDPEIRSRYAKRSRQIVILRSMESFSTENLQAMIICAFDIIGSGRGPSAWSIIGSMTRTVEQLQLSVEEDEQPQTAHLIRRLAFLPLSTCWSEIEDRRRVFWNIFLMDRFCSITTGWNLSLTSADVRRRLPCEGALWESGEPLATPTPYFGVSDQPRCTGSYLPMARPDEDDQGSLGGFAYCIEATESLSLVTSFFLQQAVVMANTNEVQMWLIRFKELDLRLIRWKLFLPSRWQQACALNADGIMDPNQTLAHITHNTAVVLLHQGIAYPSAEWANITMRLPMSSSAETCLAAATEVSTIAEKFLQGSSILTNPQFAFCLFVSGRMFLVHASYYNVQLAAAFQSIVDSLWEIASRWSGFSNSIEADNLASKFASRLLCAQQQGASSSIDIRHAAYAQESDRELPSLVHTDTSPIVSSGYSRAQATNLVSQRPDGSVPIDSSLDGMIMMPLHHHDSPDTISMAFPPLPLAFQGNGAGQASNASDLAHIENGAQKSIPHPGSLNLDASSLELDNLNSYLNYDYMLSQRVSMFSQNE